ncbi:MAG: CvpA family protein [Clostridia bacterium]|nr:CvpA family protein [Clostridia bacterium]
MLILDIVLIALIALGAWSGKKKGLVGIVVSFASLILSIVLAFAFQSVVADAIYDIGLGETVKDMAQESIQKQIDAGKTEDASFYGQIISNVADETQIEQTAESVSRFVMKGLSFIAIFLIVNLICYILQMVLNVVFNLPILSAINGTGGIVVGALSVLIKIWIVLALLSFVAPLPMFASVMNYIDQTILTKLLYNNNLLVAAIKLGLNL